MQNTKVDLEKSLLSVFWCPRHSKTEKKKLFNDFAKKTPTALRDELKSQNVENIRYF